MKNNISPLFLVVLCSLAAHAASVRSYFLAALYFVLVCAGSLTVRIRGRSTIAREWLQITIVLCLVLSFGAAFVTKNGIFGGLCLFLGILQIVFGFQERTVREIRLSLLISILHMVAFGVATSHWISLIIFLCYFLAFPLALARTEFRSGRSAGRLSWFASSFMLAICLCGSFMMFLYLPRSGHGPKPPPGNEAARFSGFSTEIDLNYNSGLDDDPTPVMRVKVPDHLRATPLYLKGVSLGIYEEGRWILSGRALRPAERSQEKILFLSPSDQHNPSVTPETVKFQIDTSSTHGVLFTVFTPVSLSGLPRELTVGVDSAENYFLRNVYPDNLSYTLSYTRTLRPVNQVKPLRNYTRHHYVQVPDNCTRIRTLARKLTNAASSSREQMVTLSAYLQSEFRYSRAGSPFDRDSLGSAVTGPLERFLFIDKQGHCEKFAGALAMLARCLDIPSRVICGFYSPGTTGPDGWRSVEQSHAHAWTEVYLPGEGWVMFDATSSRQSLPSHRSPGDIVVSLNRMKFFWGNRIVHYTRAQQMLRGFYIPGLYLAFRAGGILGTELLLFFLVLIPMVVTLVIMLFGLKIARSKQQWLLSALKSTISSNADPLKKNDHLRSSINFYDRLLAVLDSAGIRKLPHETALEYAKRIQNLPGEEARRHLTRLFCLVRYNSHTLTADEKKLIKKQLDDLRSILDTMADSPSDKRKQKPTCTFQYMSAEG